MDWKTFRIRLMKWEYWPFTVAYLPIFIYWIWLSLKARSLLYFTASNPGIRNGGMLGESKSEILKQIPNKYIPASILIESDVSNEEILTRMKDAGLAFPVIFKPDMGERGKGVHKITHPEEIDMYRKEIRTSFIIQEFVDLPVELGVFYSRIPGGSKGKISSVVLKEMLFVTGDGVSTLEELVQQNDRAYLQKKTLMTRWAPKWKDVIPKDKKFILETVGNHCRGTKFLNGNFLITGKLTEIFDSLSDEIPGFNFGRFDLRTRSFAHLERGEFKIMELNGAGSEPAHIYDPAVTVTDAYRSLFWHWKTLYRISRENHKNGIPYLSLRDGIREYRNVLKNQQLKHS
ncbi:ATP-grasp domain-containing protein [Fulvivirga sedimenti]|uniref:ATP-grasp domain-containing protein n=1 Tax=Fulvivirga sedimenti TaxID=2879465 RepID=A0A9X1HQE5_9BACT|nr:ATP-grasp domain-containing protein [Fulvivirga sedimenti]MCA6074414.1 ATP-grasp domain-containing protein [Fulvivirga sedimenti]